MLKNLEKEHIILRKQSNKYEYRTDVIHSELLSVKLNSEHVKKQSCKKCDLTFSDYKELKHHMNNSHQQTFQCTECNSNFKRGIELEQHLINVHQADKKHKCDQCDLSFTLNWRLKKHM